MDGHASLDSAAAIVKINVGTQTDYHTVITLDCALLKKKKILSLNILPREVRLLFEVQACHCVDNSK